MCKAVPLLFAALTGLAVPLAGALQAPRGNAARAALQRGRSGGVSAACHAAAEAAAGGSFDVTITWFVSKTQSEDQRLHDPDALIGRKPVTFIQERIENNNEIAYLLRGMDQFGMLPHVRRIYVVLDREVVKNYGAPRKVNWSNPKLRAVYTQDLNITGASSEWAKLATFHRIPGISEWFLYIPDDILVTSDFSMDMLFNGKMPRFWMNKDLYVTPQKDCPMKDGMSILQGPAHLPWLVSRCHMEQVEREYATNFKAVRADESNEFDAHCVYDSWMNGQGLTSKSYDHNNHYGVVCHLGTHWSQCPIGTDAAGEPNAGTALKRVLEDPPVFLNLQGMGYSDEYAADDVVTRASLKWLHAYKPSDLTVNNW